MLKAKFFLTYSSVLAFALLMSGGASLHADPDESPATAPSPTPEVKAPAANASPKKGRKPVEKETEGSEAPNRFETNTVIKSRYQLDGESLEVDPD